MIFYVPDVDAREVETPHSAHMLSMRVRYKDKIVVTDLKGNWARASVGNVDKKHKLVKYHLRKRGEVENTNSGVLVQAIPDKLYLEKLVEVGALQGMKKIYFYYSERSVRQKIKEDRLQRIVLRACELSEHYWAPEIEFVEGNAVEGLLAELKPVVLEASKVGKEAGLVETNERAEAILVGPEGGWSRGELAGFKETGLKFASLGETVYPAWLAGFAYFERQKNSSTS